MCEKNTQLAVVTWLVGDYDEGMQNYSFFPPQDSPHRLRTLVVARHRLTHRVLCAFLSTIKRLDVLNERPTHENLLAKTAALKPNLVLLDWSMLGEDCDEYIKRAQMMAAPKKIIFIVLVKTNYQKEWAQEADWVMLQSTEPSAKLQDYIHELLFDASKYN